MISTSTCILSQNFIQLTFKNTYTKQDYYVTCNCFFQPTHQSHGIMISNANNLKWNEKNLYCITQMVRIGLKSPLLHVTKKEVLSYTYSSRSSKRTYAGEALWWVFRLFLDNAVIAPVVGFKINTVELVPYSTWGSRPSHPSDSHNCHIVQSNHPLIS